MAFGLSTYPDLAQREDLLDILADINPTEEMTLLQNKKEEAETLKRLLEAKL